MKKLRGHIDHTSTLWILGILAAIALWEYLPAAWFWSGAAACAAGAVGFAALHGRRMTPRIERAEGRTIVHFDGRRIEWTPAPLQTEEWTSGGAFGQPLVNGLTVKRNGEEIYSGPSADARRLLACLESLSEKAPLEG